MGIEILLQHCMTAAVRTVYQDTAYNIPDIGQSCQLPWASVQELKLQPTDTD